MYLNQESNVSTNQSMFKNDSFQIHAYTIILNIYTYMHFNMTYVIIIKQTLTSRSEENTCIK